MSPEFEKQSKQARAWSLCVLEENMKWFQIFMSVWFDNWCAILGKEGDNKSCIN